jgi:hypothetical protein
MLSIPKLIILILVAIAGWYLYKAIKRRGLDGIFKRSGPETKTGGAAKSDEPKALDMEKCRICGDFVPADARACAQARCPYPQA